MSWSGPQEHLVQIRVPYPQMPSWFRRNQMRSEAEDAGCGPYVSAATCGVQPREMPLSGEQAAGPHCEPGGSCLPTRDVRILAKAFFFPLP